jgi:hypothetical protein
LIKNETPKFIPIMIILLLTPLFANAIETTTTNTDPFATITQQITAEGIKTRTELTKYTDAKIEQFWKQITSEGKNIYEENLAQFDRSIHILAVKVQIQFAITTFLVIILSLATWYFIKRQIEKLYKPKPKHLERTEIIADKYGLVSEEHLQKIQLEQLKNIKETPFADTTPTTPRPPSVDEILKKIAEDKKKREEEQQKAQKIREEIQKLEQKAEQKTKRIKNKIQDLKKEMPELKLVIDEPPTPPLRLSTKNNEDNIL